MLIIKGVIFCEALTSCIIFVVKYCERHFLYEKCFTNKEYCCYIIVILWFSTKIWWDSCSATSAGGCDLDDKPCTQPCQDLLAPHFGRNQTCCHIKAVKKFFRTAAFLQKFCRHFYSIFKHTDSGAARHTFLGIYMGLFKSTLRSRIFSWRE